MSLPRQELDAVLAAALRRALADVDLDASEYDANRELSLAAQVLVRAIDELPEEDRPSHWRMTDAERAGAELKAATEANEYLRGTLNSLYKCLEVYHDHLARYPFDEDLRDRFRVAVDEHIR